MTVQILSHITSTNKKPRTCGTRGAIVHSAGKTVDTPFGAASQSILRHAQAPTLPRSVRKIIDLGIEADISESNYRCVTLSKDFYEFTRCPTQSRCMSWMFDLET